MAVNRLSGTVDETRQGVARLEENGHENKRLHAETIRVTDSLAKSVDALNVAVATAVPGFIGHDIEQRKT